jgi:hypothetical protein
MKNKFQKATISDILSIYSALSALAVLFSSYLFLTLVLLVLLNSIGIATKSEHLLFVIIIICFFFTNKKQSKKIKKFGKYLGKTIIALMSILIILLFLNNFIVISQFSKEVFLIVWNVIETAINKFVLGTISMFLFIFIYFELAGFFIKFITDTIKGKFLKIVIGTTVLIIFPVILIIVFLNTSEAKSISNLFYNKISYFLGFSLIFLHLDYLVKETKKFLKGSSI